MNELVRAMRNWYDLAATCRRMDYHEGWSHAVREALAMERAIEWKRRTRS